MFSSISWQEFISTALVVIAIYYVIAFLVLYSRDFISKFRKTSSAKESTPLDEEVSSEVSLMGPVKKDALEKYHQNLDSHDLTVEPSDSTASIANTEDALLIGTVSDLLNEIKVLTRVLSESKGSKDDGSPMFQSLLSNYPQLLGTKYQDSISIFIHDQCRTECDFDLHLAEVKSWWPVSNGSQNNNQIKLEL